ncbi:MAG: BatA and WFA domain-containing protein [Planctomycetota bacterium]|nr:BatA and WFA domain-containing protein [Planctomycetota bacterium]MDA1180293.1 BatA and WFA domain-containing protein [Planctomycetota bacterium]
MSWPGFLSWQYAWLALLAVPLIVFYFLKLRRPKVRIPSLMLWAQVIHDQRVNSPFQRFKRNLLLLLQLLLLMALVLAAMQLFWPLQEERGRYLTVLIDTSASMAARDSVSGRTRIELAKQSIGKLIDDLMADQKISLIAVTSTAQRLTDFTDNKRALRDALTQVRVQDVPSSLDDALRMTQAMSRSVRIDSVLLYTDGNLPERVDFELPFEVNYQQMGKAEPNLGITAFTARRAGAKAWQVFVGIDASAGTVSGAKVQLRQEGKVIAEDYTSVKGDASPRVMFTIDAESAINLEAALIPDGTDALDSDNVAYLQLPLPRPLRIYCPPEMEAFRHALGQLPDVEVHPSDGVNDTSGKYDLWIGNTQFPPDGLVAPVRLVVGVVPPPLEKIIQLTEGSAEVIDWHRSSPLLQYVQLTDVITTDQVVQAAGTADTDVEQLGFEILVHGRTGPLLVREVGQTYHAFHLLFHPERSTLVYRVGFPILVKNLVRAAQQTASLSEIGASQTGVLACHGLEPTTSYRVELPGGTAASAVTGSDGRLLGVAAPVVGAYTVSRNGEQVRTASASLLSAMETQLVAREELLFRETAVTAAVDTVAQDRPFWTKFAWCAFALLLLEWLYFHRRVDRATEAPSSRSSTRRTVKQTAVKMTGIFLAVLLANGLAGRIAIANDVAPDGKMERHGLRAEYDLTGSRQREDAPLLATWKVNWEKEYLLQGNFRIEFFKDRIKYQVYESDQYALTQGDRVVRMLLPATSGPQFWIRHWMHVVFVGNDREYDLGDFDVALPSDRHKCGLCRIASSANTIGASIEDEIARQMRFESFLEQDTTRQAASWIPNTVVTPWEFQDMPLSPFYYTPFDIVFLGSAAFRSASAKQVDILDQWVQAGGRLCLCLHDFCRSIRTPWRVNCWRQQGPNWSLPSKVGHFHLRIPPPGLHAEGSVASDLLS